jgi:uncharacterized membrane protein YkoI
MGMRKTMMWLGASAVVGVLAAVTVDAGDAKKLAPGDVPKKIMDTVKARLPGAEVTSAEKETENGAIVFDLEMKDGGRKYEMDIKEDGTLVEIEKQVLDKDVPAAVTQALNAKYPGSAVKEVMEVNSVKGTRETPEHYEVVIATGGKEKEVVVSLDGKSVKEEEDEK